MPCLLSITHSVVYSARARTMVQIVLGSLQGHSWWCWGRGDRVPRIEPGKVHILPLCVTWTGSPCFLKLFGVFTCFVFEGGVYFESHWVVFRDYSKLQSSVLSPSSCTVSFVACFGGHIQWCSWLYIGCQGLDPGLSCARQASYLYVMLFVMLVKSDPKM